MSAAASVLIALIDPRERSSLALLLRREGCEAIAVARSCEIARELERADPLALLVDPELFGGDAQFGAFAAAQTRPVIAVGELADARRWLERGASDLLERPIARERLALAIERARKLADVADERDRLRREADRRAPRAWVARSAAMRRVDGQVDRAAFAVRATVLLRASAACAAEPIAREIHRRSAQAARAFLVLRCADRTLCARDLDMVAGARGDRGPGTILLDGVERLTAPLQAALAQRLRERALDRRATPPRLIATTSIDLAAASREGRFNEDLFYRLNALSIEAPSLAERVEDLAELARIELARQASLQERPTPRLCDRAAAAIEAHAWPGDQAELEAVLARALWLAADGAIEAEHLGLGTPAAGQSLELRDRSLRSVEETLIRRVLVEQRGNKCKAARALGINRATLYNKLKALAIDG